MINKINIGLNKIKLTKEIVISKNLFTRNYLRIIFLIAFIIEFESILYFFLKYF